MYGKSFVLTAPLTLVECWNCSDGSTGSFEAGETITVKGVYDATHTTIRCAEEHGRPLTHKDGTPNKSKGYLFIVPNEMLAKAIPAEVPLKTADLVGDLIAYEAGESTPEQEEALFDTLRETGVGKGLQGRYSSRM